MDRETVIRLADESGFDVIPADQYMEQDHIADSGNLWITDRLERFAAAVEANCVPKWQPIETAPKDGTRILVRSCGSTFVAGWDRVWEAETDGWCIVNDAWIHEREATHWMPLPSAPAQREES